MASTSVMVALAQHCDENDSVGGVRDGGAGCGAMDPRNMRAFSHLPTGGNHAEPADIRSIMATMWGEQLWDQYLKVTIVRNPWDRAVSWLDYARNTLGVELSSDEGLKNTERGYWFDKQGRPWADWYLRYEQLAEDYSKLLSKLGLPPGSLPHLRPGKRDRKRPYQDHFNSAQRELIAREFALEIAHFGYRFEASA